MPRFYQCVLDECRTRLFGIGNAVFGLRDDFDVESVEDALQADRLEVAQDAVAEIVRERARVAAAPATTTA